VDLSDSTVDFHGQATAVMCFSVVFGYSRWQFLRFTKTANAHSVCHSHVLAFEEAGGTPQEILWDRRKQVLLESCARRVVFHPLFAALVKHYGFEPIPLAPGYKEGKGKVENPFKYVDSDFVKGTTLHDLDDLNRQAEAWLRDIAWVRQHGTTQQRPLNRMYQKRPYLIPHPAHAFVAAQVEQRLVNYDFCVAWDTNRYSLSPSFVGRSVKALALDGIRYIYWEGEIAPPLARYAPQTLYPSRTPERVSPAQYQSALAPGAVSALGRHRPNRRARQGACRRRATTSPRS
jgi:hypothetical protein